MFDIGFFELIIIAVVGLLVIGPERLPETLRTIVLGIGRFKRGMRDTRMQIEQQLGTDDIRRQLHNEEVMQKLEETRKELNMSVTEDTFANPNEPFPSDKGSAQAETNHEAQDSPSPAKPAPSNTQTSKSES